MALKLSPPSSAKFSEPYIFGDVSIYWEWASSLFILIGVVGL